MGWHVFAASAVGQAHAECGLPCQDSFAYQVRGELLCAAVCDGAGSAQASDLGAQRLAARLVAQLGQLHVSYASPALALQQVYALLAPLIESVRHSLEHDAIDQGCALDDFAATLVGVLATPDGGWFFHVGDGVAVAQPQHAHEPVVLSLPENGEYSNETFFVTGAEWRAHLRLTRIEPALRGIVLMSDGAAPFVMSRGNAGLYAPFVEPVERFLQTATVEVGSSALAATLADPRTHAITGDDKTLLIAQWRPEPPRSQPTPIQP